MYMCILLINTYSIVYMSRQPRPRVFPYSNSRVLSLRLTVQYLLLSSLGTTLTLYRTDYCVGIRFTIIYYELLVLRTVLELWFLAMLSL